MDLLKKFLNLVNGRKTLIGTTIFFVAMQLQANGLVDQEVLNSLNKDAELFGTILAIVGFGHKGVKLVQAKLNQ